MRLVPPVLFCTIAGGIVRQGAARDAGTTVFRSLIVFFGITVLIAIDRFPSAVRVLTSGTAYVAASLLVTRSNGGRLSSVPGSGEQRH